MLRVRFQMLVGQEISQRMAPWNNAKGLWIALPQMSNLWDLKNASHWVGFCKQCWQVILIGLVIKYFCLCESFSWPHFWQGCLVFFCSSIIQCTLFVSNWPMVQIMCYIIYWVPTTPAIMTCRDRTPEFTATIKSIQSRQVTNQCTLKFLHKMIG